MAIEAPAVGVRGGLAILEALLAELRELPSVGSVTVFGLTDDAQLPGVDHRRVIPNTYRARMQWALAGWAAESARFDRTLSFTGFARPASGKHHTCFIHNALYYEDRVRLLSPSLRARLSVLKRLTHLSARTAGRVVVQAPHMADHVYREHEVDAEVVVTAPTLPKAAPGRVLGGEHPRLLMVGNEFRYKRWELLLSATEGLPVTTHFVGFSPSCMRTRKASYCYPHLSRAEIHRAMLESDLLVMTSECESLGLPLYEALEAGLPIIAPALPYARFACGDHARYFEAGHVESLRAAIEDRLRLGAGREREQCTPSKPGRTTRRDYSHRFRNLL